VGLKDTTGPRMGRDSRFYVPSVTRTSTFNDVPGRGDRAALGFPSRAGKSVEIARFALCGEAARAGREHVCTGQQNKKRGREQARARPRPTPHSPAPARGGTPRGCTRSPGRGKRSRMQRALQQCYTPPRHARSTTQTRKQRGARAQARPRAAWNAQRASRRCRAARARSYVYMCEQQNTNAKQIHIGGPRMARPRRLLTRNKYT
jgi:hypothetical protein